VYLVYNKFKENNQNNQMPLHIIMFFFRFPATRCITRNASALMHMIKSTIGGGFLAMPEAFHNAGLLVGTVGTMVLGIAVLNMMSFIVSIDIFVYSV